MSHGLGRLPSTDKRDKRFLLKTILPVTTGRRYRAWPGYRWRLDQGQTPQCVAYAWTHFLVDSPITHRPATLPVGTNELYHRAQLVDEWEGEGYDGTSVRAGAKVLQESKLIAEYRWAWNLTDIITCILEQGPVVVGTNWYESMFRTDANGFVMVTGDVAGGHAYKLDAVNLDARRFRLKNSWSKAWGRLGYALISFTDMERLIAEDGEACLALEA